MRRFKQLIAGRHWDSMQPDRSQFSLQTPASKYR